MYSRVSMKCRPACLAAVVVLAASASAFSSPPSRRFVSRATLSKLKSPYPKSVARGGALNIFGKFFGGGLYNTKIDYTGLEVPGPELAAAAKAGKVLQTSPRDSSLSVATVAGGCFWGMELAYQRIPGVVYTAAGYTQGREEEPTYEQICAGATGHTEAVIVYYDPAVCSYESLLDVFFERVDPTTIDGQGRDRGKQYRTGVYFHTREQEEFASARFEKEQAKRQQRIASECKPAMPFWPAEKYHQQYLQRGGRFGTPQSAEKGATDTIRCYG